MKEKKTKVKFPKNVRVDRLDKFQNTAENILPIRAVLVAVVIVIIVIVIVVIVAVVFFAVVFFATIDF